MNQAMGILAAIVLGVIAALVKGPGVLMIVLPVLAVGAALIFRRNGCLVPAGAQDAELALAELRSLGETSRQAEEEWLGSARDCETPLA
jgi:hypothetical protein